MAWPISGTQTRSCKPTAGKSKAKQQQRQQKKEGKRHDSPEQNFRSIYFAAPELLVKALYKGPEVDIWALGVILYVMLYGRVPFEDRQMHKLYEKIKMADLHWHESIYISNSAKELIKRMLTVDQRKRATLAEVMNHPWVNENYATPPHKCVFFF